MSITNIKKTEGLGGSVLKKTIHEGSIGIMFSVLQSSQYSKPYKSAVREIISNSLDSIKERDNALKILNGELKVSDLYLKKEGEEFKDSGFDKDYYDPKWLSDDPTAQIIYIENDPDTRDRIQFVDNGVGLGKDRLINSFSLGFSTKRASKSQTGSFGLGAKSLISTGVDFYTITSRYKGDFFKFDVYKDHVISKVDKFAKDGTLNKKHTFIQQDGSEFVYYSEPTELKNGVIVEAEVRRHRKEDYITGVESQLGYISNIEFIIKDKLYDPEGTKRDITATILYQDEFVVVGDNDYYAKPQLLLKPGKDSTNYISYGKISFEDMDLNDRRGNVALIIDINEVDVTPSREQVIWNARTRDVIKKMFVKAQAVIEKQVEDKLSVVSCLYEHNQLFSTLKGNGGNFGPLSELVKLIDITDLSSKYKTFDAGEAVRQLRNNEVMQAAFSERKGYGTSATLEDIDYGLSSFTASYRSVVWSNLAKGENNTVVYVGSTRYKGIAPYLAKKFGLSVSGGVRVIYIRQDYYDRRYVENLVATAYDKGEKADHMETLFAETMYLVEHKGLPLLMEADIDKAAMKEAVDNQKIVETSAGLTTGQRAKLDGKLMVYSHNSNLNYSYQEYKDEAFFQAVKDVVLYRRSDDALNELMKHSYRSYSTSSITLIGAGREAYERFIKVPGVKSLEEACYTIRYGELEITSFGKSLFSSNTQTLIRFFNLKGKFANLKLLHNEVKAVTDSGIYTIKRERKNVTIEPYELDDSALVEKLEAERLLA